MDASYEERSLLERTRMIKDLPFHGRSVIYWMSRERRVNDNWSLLYAAAMARSHNVSLGVVHCVPPEYLGSTIRQYAFMMDGLKEMAPRLHELNIGFDLLEGYPEVVLPSYLHQVGAGLLVSDFDPLDINRIWTRRVAGEIDIAIHQVDSHNIVPCWKVANRRIHTYSTFRRRIEPLLGTYLTDPPPLRSADVPWPFECAEVDWKGVLDRSNVDGSVQLVTWAVPGEKAAERALADFCERKVHLYGDRSMNPVLNGQSDLSPYLHFGQLSAQRVALEVRRADAKLEDKEKFLDNLIIKKELADNFCLHTPDYDTTGGYPVWAKRSLNEHRSDERDHIYPLAELEGAATHDPLWNAAQKELLKIGKIHGSLRAYWAGKILEWSPSPEEALFNALYLNNRYSLDGNDPVGYTGIAMVIGGLYGRPWMSKDVLGKLKKLTYTQERFSYDLRAFIDKVDRL